MNKVIIICAILIAVFAYTEANRCRNICGKKTPNPVRCVQNGKICRKIRQCSIDEENCRRRLLKLNRITSTNIEKCANIKGPKGTGRCVLRKKRNARPHCPRCGRGDSKKQNCYTNRKGRCQILTPCQVTRANCLRGPHKRLEWVDSRRCAGMKAGQKLQKCRPGPK